MKVLIKSAKIYNSVSAFHLNTKDILVEDGVITSIENEINDDQAQLVQGKGLAVSAGWFDLYSVVREPGNEAKDTIQTLLDSAQVGGFTDLIGVSGSTPSLYSRAQIEFVKNNSKGRLVNIHPVGTITEKKEGKNITELYDLHKAGALAFSDGKRHFKNPELLKRALLYIKPFNGKLMVYGEDADIADYGMVNEGVVGAGLGMKVRPALAEEIALQRNIHLVEYTDSSIHVQAISSKGSVEIVKAAKAKGVNITCDVNLANLLYTDEKVGDFDTTYKVLPVLRTEEDRQALLAGLESGVIDGISSGHTPQDNESKACEFDHAEFGMMTLEAMGASLLDEGSLTEESIFSLLSEKSRDIFKVTIPEIKVGELASLTVCSNNSWSLAKADITSISKNSPFIGNEFNHKVEAVLNNNMLYVNK
ncbi:MAG: dihydroorotase [Glaciecola sp.]|jgi:dihydroorotase